ASESVALSCRFHKEIATCFVIVILALVGFAGYRFYTSRRNSTAAELLGNAKTPHEYQEVIDRYAGTPAGASAYLLLAETQRDEKKFAQANSTLQMFV